MSETAYLLLGSNLGDRLAVFSNALDKIRLRAGDVVSESPCYETDPVGFVSDDKFLNMAVGIRTELSPYELLSVLQSVEKELGRVRRSLKPEVDESGIRVYKSRTIDIDILMYGKEVIDSDMLQIPHPRMAERAFAMYPFMDIAPDLVHPVYGESISDMVRKRFGGKMPDGIVRIGRMP